MAEALETVKVVTREYLLRLLTEQLCSALNLASVMGIRSTTRLRYFRALSPVGLFLLET